MSCGGGWGRETPGLVQLCARNADTQREKPGGGRHCRCAGLCSFFIKCWAETVAHPERVARLGAERPQQLTGETLWSLLAVETIALRLSRLREMGCAEQEILEGQEAAIVFVQGGGISRMMPAMERGARHDIADPAIAPTDIAVDEDGIDADESRDARRHLRRKAQ
jgi:hypothetical protein